MPSRTEYDAESVCTRARIGICCGSWFHEWQEYTLWSIEWDNDIPNDAERTGIWAELSAVCMGLY